MTSCLIGQVQMKSRNRLQCSPSYGRRPPSFNCNFTLHYWHGRNGEQLHLNTFRRQELRVSALHLLPRILSKEADKYIRLSYIFAGDVLGIIT